jgi:hypothetical protein
MEGEELRSFLLASIISAENDRYTEDVKQEVIRRYDIERNNDHKDWQFILEPIGADNRLLELFED